MNDLPTKKDGEKLAGLVEPCDITFTCNYEPKELNHRFTNVDGSVTLDELNIICVGSKKHACVELCIKAGMNIPFAQIKLYDRDRFADAEATFESAEAIGKEIERCWNVARPDLLEGSE